MSEYEDENDARGFANHAARLDEERRKGQLGQYGTPKNNPNAMYSVANTPGFLEALLKPGESAISQEEAAKGR